MGSAVRPAIGTGLRITLANETVQGTRPSASAFNKRFDPLSESLSNSESTIDSTSIRDTRNRPKQARGVFDVGGDLACEFGTAGFGRPIYHALGDYVVMADVDGAAHGRLALNVDTTTAQFAEFKSDRIVGFEVDGSTSGLALVYKRNDGTLVYDNNGGSWYAYTKFSPALFTSVRNAVDLTTTVGEDQLEINVGENSATFLDQEASGDSAFCYIQIQDRQFKLTYSAVDVSTVGSGYFTLTVTHVNGVALGVTSPLSGVGGNTRAGAPAWQHSCLWRDSGDDFLFDGYSDSNNGYGLAATTIPSGAWVYGLWEDAADSAAENIYTHHFEVAKDLPVGMSVEILRDSVNFVYTGCMVGTWVTNFDAQSFISSTFTLAGMREYSIVSLAREAAPGDTAIYVREEPLAHPDSAGLLTIGEEGGIAHTGYDAPGVGGNTTDYYRFNGIPSSGATSIQQTHKIGTNVDSMTTVASTPPSIVNAPKFSSFEATVAQNEALIEVLSGSVTVNNNPNTDKYILGDRYRAAIREGRAIVDGTISLEFDSGYQYKKFLDGEEFSIEFRCLSEDRENTINGLYHPTCFYMFMPTCRYTGTTPNVSDDQYILQEAPFSAYEDDTVLTGNSSLTVIITNRLSNEN